jgi:hypothetical protein
MSTDLETWHCGKCPYSVLIPWQELSPREYADVLMRVREHRFAHLVDALQTATDEELMGMSGDDESDEREGADPVESEDTPYVLAGVTELLKADLPRARKEQGI